MPQAHVPSSTVAGWEKDVVGRALDNSDTYIYRRRDMCQVPSETLLHSHPDRRRRRGPAHILTPLAVKNCSHWSGHMIILQTLNPLPDRSLNPQPSSSKPPRNHASLFHHYFTFHREVRPPFSEAAAAAPRSHPPKHPSNQALSPSPAYSSRHLPALLCPALRLRHPFGGAALTKHTGQPLVD